MKTKCFLLLALLINFYPAQADTTVTITAKAPVEAIGTDGSVTGVSMSTLGTHYTLTQYVPVGVDGKPAVIVTDTSGQKYRIAVAATDYQPPSVPSATTNAVANQPTVTNSAPVATPLASSAPAPAATPLSDDDIITKFLTDAGLDKRLARAVELASQAKTRQLDTFDATATQSFASGLKIDNYTSDYMAAARKAYAAFTPDDLAAIANFLQGPLAKADQAHTPASPPVPGSVFDIQANAKGPQLKAMEVLGLDIRGAIKRNGLAAGRVAFLQGIPQSISNGELDGLAAGLFTAPSYASRTADIQSLLAQAKLLPARSADEQSIVDDFDKEMQREGRPPITNPIAITKAEIDEVTVPLMAPYASMLTPDQIQQWEDFANSPAGKKFYAFRNAVITAITLDLEKDWYNARFTAAKTFAQGSPDDAFALLKSIATPLPPQN